YVPRLLKQSMTGPAWRRRASVEAALDQLVPPMSVLVGGTAAWTTMVVGLASVSHRARWAAVASAGFVLFEAAYVLSALRMVEAPPAVYRSLLSVPRLVGWKARLWLRMLARPGRVSWVRTTRNVRAGEASEAGSGGPR